MVSGFHKEPVVEVARVRVALGCRTTKPTTRVNDSV